MDPVRIRGLGLVSSYGVGLDAAVRGIRANQAGITPLTLFPLPFGHQIRVNQIDHGRFSPGEDSAIEMMQVAASEAIGKAAADSLADTALVVGSNGFLFAGEAEYRLRYAQTGSRPSPLLRAPGYVAHQLADRLGVRGPVLTLSTACSSSANALLVGADILNRGEARRALIIGAEGLSSIALTGFHSLMLLDPEGCRPFDRERRGMQLGEAIGAVLLDRPADASATETRWGVLLGGANLCDIHHVTSATPDGSAMREVMAQSLADAGVSPTDVALVKAHGTGSTDNDTAEAAAIRALWGNHRPPVTAVKRYVGHTLGACGTVELTVMLGCLRAGFVPAAAGFSAADPELDLQPVTTALDAPRGPVLYNYFGFGGNYASLVVSHG